MSCSNVAECDNDSCETCSTKHCGGMDTGPYCCSCPAEDVYCPTFSTGSPACLSHATQSPTQSPTFPVNIDEDTCYGLEDCTQCDDDLGYDCITTRSSCTGATPTTVYTCNYCNCKDAYVETAYTDICSIQSAKCPPAASSVPSGSSSATRVSTSVAAGSAVGAIIIAALISVLVWNVWCKGTKAYSRAAAAADDDGTENEHGNGSDEPSENKSQQTASSDENNDTTSSTSNRSERIKTRNEISIVPSWIYSNLAMFVYVGMIVGLATGSSLLYHKWIPPMKDIINGNKYGYEGSDYDFLLTKFCPSECLNEYAYCQIEQYGLFLKDYDQVLYCGSSTDDGTFAAHSDVLCVGSSDYNNPHMDCYNVNRDFVTYFNDMKAGYLWMAVLAGIAFCALCLSAYTRQRQQLYQAADEKETPLLDNA